MLRLEEEEKDRTLSGVSLRRRYLRSVSWTDRSPTSNSTNLRAARNLLPPLSISRRNAEEWPKPGSDDLGETPRRDSDHPFEFGRDKLAFFDRECSRISDHLFLGSDLVARDREALAKNRITHVLNCVGFVCPEYFKPELTYKTLWLRDTPSEDITSVLYDVFDYFEEVRERKGRVFVHCCRGISRSSSLVIAYLMWREGLGFDEAFRRVRAERGVTNPNFGFACQLLQAQNRARPGTTENSGPRMYRMAPHSPYDPLHLVPKMVVDPNESKLDSRGVFIVHVASSTVYVWIGKSCGSTETEIGRAAGRQVVRYERACGRIIELAEGVETEEFREALPGSWDRLEERKVEEYDLDFGIFRKALAGGVVPAFSGTFSESETCLPARESGWERLRRKFSIGLMREFIANSSKLPLEMVEEEEPDYFSPSSSSSDYASSVSFSPSSSNWSDLSPSSAGTLFPIKNVPFLDEVDNRGSLKRFHRNSSLCKDGIARPRSLKIPGRSLSFSGGDTGREEVSEESLVKKAVLYEWPSMSKVEGSRLFSRLDSRSSYVMVAPESSPGERTLTFWLGRETSDEISARDFLDQMDIPLDTTHVQVVREGEEPEKFLNQLRCLALQATEDKGDG